MKEAEKRMLNITKTPIFTEEVFSFMLPNFSYWEKHIKEIVSVEDNKIHQLNTTPEEECNVKAKRTGWNSHIKYPSLNILCNEIKTYIQEFIAQENYDVPNLNVVDCWINWYGKNQHALPHHHYGFLSTVLFIDVEDTNAKFLCHANRNLSLIKKYDSHNNFSNIKEIVPKNGSCIFFDGVLNHSVSSNTTNKKRITLAINFLPYYQDKRKEY
mgnify:CR=1 FL=1